MAQVKCVILATASSERFVAQLHQRGTDIKGLAATATQHVTLPVLPVAGISVLHRWLKAVCSCPQLLPVEDNVYILSNSHNYHDLCDWAAAARLPSGSGFPVSNVLCTGSGGEPSQSIAGLARFLEASTPDSYLVVVDSTYCFEPDFNLRKVVQHALVRGKDTVCYVDTVQHMVASPNSTHLVAHLAEDTCNPSIRSFEQLDIADMTREPQPCVAPLFVFHRDTLPAIAQCSSSSSSELLQELARQRPMYGLPVGCCLSIDSLDEYLFTDAFLSHLRIQKSSCSPATKAAPLSASATSTALPDTAVRNALLEFAAIYETLLKEAAANQKLSKARAIPARFADVNLWKHRPRRQHPVYATSNNIYGAKQPSQQEMPMSWNGIRGEFTKNFVVGNGHTGFVTGISGSRVHRALDDL